MFLFLLIRNGVQLDHFNIFKAKFEAKTFKIKFSNCYGFTVRTSVWTDFPCPKLPYDDCK
jgi:hypothetical protein